MAIKPDSPDGFSAIFERNPYTKFFLNDHPYVTTLCGAAYLTGISFFTPAVTVPLILTVFAIAGAQAIIHIDIPRLKSPQSRAKALAIGHAVIGLLAFAGAYFTAAPALAVIHAIGCLGVYSALGWAGVSVVNGLLEFRQSHKAFLNAANAG